MCAGKAAAKKKRAGDSGSDDEDFMPQKKKKAPAKPKAKAAPAPEPAAVPAKAVPDIPFLVEKEVKVCEPSGNPHQHAVAMHSGETDHGSMHR